MKYIILFLFITFCLFSDTTLDRDYFDRTSDYYEYLNARQVQKDLEAMCQIEFEFTDKRFNCYLNSIYRPYWRRIPNSRGAFEVKYTDPCWEVEADKSWKGFKIDGMYYLFREYNYPEIFKKENYYKNNKNNNFMVEVWHTGADKKIYKYNYVYVCKMSKVWNVHLKDWVYMLHLYKTILKLHKGPYSILKLEEEYELSLIIVQDDK